MKYVRYINDKHNDLTKGKAYKVYGYIDGQATIHIKDDAGDIYAYFWYHNATKSILNFIDITHEYNRNKVINSILK